MLSVLALTWGCDDPRRHQQTDRLKLELASMNLAQPQEDVEKNVAKGDLRHICLWDLSSEVPGVDVSGLDRSQVRCLEGTSDAIEGDRHAALIREARAYAAAYNAALAIRLSA